MDFRVSARPSAEARRHGRLYSRALLSEDPIAELSAGQEGFGRAGSYTPAVTVWVFLGSAQPGPLLPRRRGPIDGLAAGRRPAPRLGPDRGLLLRRATDCPGTLFPLGSADGASGRRGSPRGRGAGWATASGRRRLDDHHPDTAATSEYPQLSASAAAAAPHRPRRRGVLTGGGHGAGGGAGNSGQADRENSLFRTLHPLLQEDDVVLADRYYSGWFDLGCCWGAACTAWSASTVAAHRLPTGGGWGAAITW